MKTYPLYLAGEWITTESSKPVVNPSTGEAFAAISTIGRDRVAKALESAGEAFKSWRRLPGKARGAYLHKIADHLEQRSEEVARTITARKVSPSSKGSVRLGWLEINFGGFAEGPNGG